MRNLIKGPLIFSTDGNYKRDFIFWYTCRIIHFYFNEKLTQKGFGTLRGNHANVSPV